MIALAFEQNGNNRPMNNRPFTSALTGFAVAFGVLVAKWRATKRAIAISTERDQFANLISSLPDTAVSKMLADYELLAAFDGSDRFRWKRDHCREELAKRAATESILKSPGPQSFWGGARSKREKHH